DRISEFKVERILLTDASTKLTVLLGKIGEEACLLKLSRLALPEFSLGTNLPISATSGLDANGIYSWGTGSLTEPQSCYFDVVFPATEKHIAKYTVAPKHVITETPEMYAKVVEPYIDTQKGSRIDWVRGILDDGVEADKVMFRDDKFLLLPNSNNQFEVVSDQDKKRKIRHKHRHKATKRQKNPLKYKIQLVDTPLVSAEDIREERKNKPGYISASFDVSSDESDLEEDTAQFSSQIPKSQFGDSEPALKRRPAAPSSIIKDVETPMKTKKSDNNENGTAVFESLDKKSSILDSKSQNEGGNKVSG
ncbi:hypothetical protein FF38_03698, partial [Lucilia cuprina]